MNDQLMDIASAYGPLAAFAAGLYWAILYFLDWRTGKSFRDDILPAILAGNLGLGAYYGFRNLAVALLVGYVLGPVRF